MIETDVLVVGSGPAGASAALFLSHHGVDTVVITKYRWLADTPRAHITNQRTMEILNDADVAQEALRDAVPNHLIGNSILCDTLVGREIGRIKSWGAAPDRISDYRLNSPFEICDIPQNYLEPILISNAAKRGAVIKFSTEFLSLTQDEHGVTAQVRDRVSGETYAIRAKYVIGADGGRSRVASCVGLPMVGEMGLAGSINVLFKADLTPYVAHRPSALFWMLNPEARIGGLGVGLLRMIRPWNEWLCVWSYDIARPAPEITEADAAAIVHKILGDSTIPVEISSISTWTVNKAYASQYASGRVYCVGDAVHRHPPNNGLGSNTSIQDSYNLAWKLAYVLKGIAGEGLLDTYCSERSPVGRDIVTRAITSIQETRDLLAIFEPDGQTGELDLTRVFDMAEQGADTRDRVAQAIHRKNYEFNCLGIESNIVYKSSSIIPNVSVDLSGVDETQSAFHSKLVAGARFPHVWVTRAGQEISTLDLLGKGKFTLVAGSLGTDFVEAARQLAAERGIPLRTCRIGPSGDVQDIYFDLRNRIGFGDSHVALVRPDGHVAWAGVRDGCARRTLAAVFTIALHLHDSHAQEAVHHQKEYS
jgi:2,4-dichlorophenol 6-monooxygenase